MSAQSFGLPLIYRSYKFNPEFPVIMMQESNPSSQAVFQHFHNCIEIGICEKSQKKWSIEDREYDFLPGDIFFIPPFHTHSSYRPATVSGEALYSYIYFNPEDILKPFYPNGLPMEMLWYKYINFTNKLQPDQFQEEIRLIYAILDQLLQKSPNYELLVRGLLQTLMVSFSRHYMNKTEVSTNGKPLSRILPAVSFINDNCQQSISSTFLANLCHLNQKQFIREFQMALHQTPIQYQNTIRIKNACELLTRTEDSILEIALSVGFQSVSTFNRCFRSILNTNPQSWRNGKRTVLKKNLKYSSFDSTVK